MLPYIDSNNFIEFVFNVGLFISYVIIVLIFFLIIFNYWSVNKEQKNVLYKNAWNVAFKDIESGTIASLPLIKNQKEYIIFIRFWLQRIESANNKQQQNLLHFINDLRPEETLFEMLNHKNINYKAMAIKALLHLKYKQFEPKLYEVLKGQNLMLSILSAQVLIEIEPKTAIGDIVDFYLKKDDWIYKKICQILEKVEEKDLSKILLNMLKVASTEQMVKIVKLFTIIDEQTAYDEAKILITKHDNPIIIAASLAYINRKEDRGILLVFTKHESWEVRLSAIKSLANILIPEDINTIALLLSDKFWKIRHHTAKVLISQSFSRAKYLDELQFSLVDKNAKKTLSMVRGMKGV